MYSGGASNFQHYRDMHAPITRHLRCATLVFLSGMLSGAQTARNDRLDSAPQKDKRARTWSGIASALTLREAFEIRKRAGCGTTVHVSHQTRVRKRGVPSEAVRAGLCVQQFGEETNSTSYEYVQKQKSRHREEHEPGLKNGQLVMARIEAGIKHDSKAANYRRKMGDRDSSKLDCVSSF